MDEGTASLAQAVLAAVGGKLETKVLAEKKAGRVLDQNAERVLTRSLVASELKRHDMDAVSAGIEPVSEEVRHQVMVDVVNQLFGMSQLQQLLDDPEIENISINGFDEVYVDRRDGTRKRIDRVCDSDEALISLVRSQLLRSRFQRTWSEASPFLDLQLPDGQRLNAVAWVGDRPYVSIRRHDWGLGTLEDLLARNSVSPSLMHFFKAAVAARLNILVAGSTDAGKTTFLRCLLNEVPAEERLLVVESDPELGLRRMNTERHVVELESREAQSEGGGGVTLDDLLRNGLRQRPDRVVVGEVRGDEVLSMLLAMTQGQDGSMCTIHSRSAVNSFSRIETYMSLTPQRFGKDASISLVAEAVQLVVFVSKIGDGTRVVHSVIEVGGIGPSGVLWADIYGPDEFGRAVPKNTSFDYQGQLQDAGFDMAYMTPTGGGWQ